MLETILNNRLLLGAVIFLLLLLVPVLVVGGHKLRNYSRLDRRKQPRPGVDRRA